jgi:hypothetical protein
MILFRIFLFMDCLLDAQRASKGALQTVDNSSSILGTDNTPDSVRNYAYDTARTHIGAKQGFAQSRVPCVAEVYPLKSSSVVPIGHQSSLGP